MSDTWFDVFVVLPSGRQIRTGRIDVSTLPNRYAPSANFTYAAEYLSDPDAYALSPDLDLFAGRQDAPLIRVSGLHTAFEDAAPDTWGRGLIRAEHTRAARAAGTRANALTQADYLVKVPDVTRQGALRFAGPDGVFLGAAEVRIPTFLDLDRLVAAAKAYERNELDDDALAMLMPAGSSQGGARPKSTVRTDSGRLALAKLPRESDRSDAMAWEATALHLARDAGIHTPDFRHIAISEDRSVLVVDRFDRNEERRIGYLSAASLLSSNEGDQVDYLTLSGAVAGVSAQPRDDAHEIFRRAAFSSLINNVDDHMRNHGLIRKAQGWQLSPVFDVNPHPYAEIAASPLVRGGDPADRDVRELIDAASDFRLTREQAVDIVRAVEGATARWRDVALLYVSDRDAIPGYAAAFETPTREIARAVVAAGVTTTLDLAARATTPTPTPSRAVWIESHLRGGKPVAGYWRHEDE